MYFHGMSEAEFEEEQRRERERAKREALSDAIAKWFAIVIWVSPVVGFIGFMLFGR